MPIHPVTSLDDPRVQPYRNLKDRQLAREHGLFICEGEPLARRLLDSPLNAHSILAAAHRAAAIAADAPADVPVFAAPADLLSDIVGYPFHRGVLACGVRPKPVRAGALLPATTLVVCPQLENEENLGVIIRTAAALGADGILLGDQGADPLGRRTVRVSMGAVFTLPVAQSPDLRADLLRLREEHGFELAATVLDEHADDLADYRRPDKLALLLGNEPTGLADDWLALCDAQLTIPMHRGTDSLNVAVAAGIFLYELLAKR
ncbi:MAG: TrmH family RNA methyltransferase [Phycisphaeraceae bacterium]